jgi:hypothetical protein
MVAAIAIAKEESVTTPPKSIEEPSYIPVDASHPVPAVQSNASSTSEIHGPSRYQQQASASQPPLPPPPGNHPMPQQQQQLQQQYQMPSYSASPMYNYATVPPQSYTMASYPTYPVPMNTEYRPYMYTPSHSYHQQLQPQPQPQPQQQQFPLLEQERRPDYWAMASAATVVGGVLGLSAAAAVRWWNGDDWYVVTPGSTKEEEEVTTVDHTSSRNVEVVPLPTTESTITIGQEYTNRSMDLLRQHQRNQLPIETSVNHETMLQLRDIQVSLTKIQVSLGDSTTTNCNTQHDPACEKNNVTAKSTTTMEYHLQSRLESILSKLESILTTTYGSDDVTVLDENVVEPVSTIINNMDVETASQTHVENTTDDTLPITPMYEMNSNDIVPDLSNATESSEQSVVALREAITHLVRGNNDDDDDNASTTTTTTIPAHGPFLSGIQLLYLYATNIYHHPRIPRYRRIYCANESYRQHVETFHGAHELLSAIGFVMEPPPPPPPVHQRNNNQRTSKYWEWLPSSSSSVLSSTPEKTTTAVTVDWEAIYMERLREAISALGVLKSVSKAIDKEELLQSALISSGLLVDSSNNISTEALATTPTDGTWKPMEVEAHVAVSAAESNNNLPRMLFDPDHVTIDETTQNSMATKTLELSTREEFLETTLEVADDDKSSNIPDHV